MTNKQQSEIRAIVDAGGWIAVRTHPVYGPIWCKVLADQRRFEAAVDSDEA